MTNNIPHGHALRKGRISIADQIYLVTCVAYDRRPVFQDLQSGRHVVQALRYASSNKTAETLAYVVMPDHLHWLLSLGDGVTLSCVVGAMKRHSARRINEVMHRSVRTVWQRGFHDHALRQDESVQDVARYVVANPLRAGLVCRLGDYALWDAIWLNPWSRLQAAPTECCGHVGALCKRD
jgi:putative transposase